MLSRELDIPAGTLYSRYFRARGAKAHGVRHAKHGSATVFYWEMVESPATTRTYRRGSPR